MTFKNIDKKKCIIYIFLFILGFFIFAMTYFYAEDDEEVLVKNDLKKETLVNNKETSTEKYKVDIKGAVVNPGIYEIEKGKRVSDVINLSGGLKDNADTNYINLSKKVSDEMVIIIYTKEEILNMNTESTAVKYVDKECICPSIKNDGCIGNNKVTNEKETSNSSDIPSTVNLNTASKEELMNLPGIGESKAREIIKYREKTPFTKIDDLLNVNGIGEATFEKLKDYITV